jgi:hypothetical protein
LKISSPIRLACKYFRVQSRFNRFRVLCAYYKFIDSPWPATLFESVRLNFVSIGGNLKLSSIRFALMCNQFPIFLKLQFSLQETFTGSLYINLCAFGKKTKNCCYSFKTGNIFYGSRKFSGMIFFHCEKCLEAFLSFANAATNSRTRKSPSNFGRYFL